MIQSTDTARLAELVGQKHLLLTQMCELGRRQLEFIEAGEMSQLFKVLSAKQRLLTGLQTLERSLDPFRPQEPATRKWSSEEDRLRCSQLISRCEELLREAMQQERDSEQKLLVRQERTAQQLSSLHHAEESRSAYADELSPVHVQLDLSTES